jgi:hypothetical protein
LKRKTRLTAKDFPGKTPAAVVVAVMAAAADARTHPSAPWGWACRRRGADPLALVPVPSRALTIVTLLPRARAASAMRRESNCEFELAGDRGAFSGREVSRPAALVAVVVRHVSWPAPRQFCRASAPAHSARGFQRCDLVEARPARRNDHDPRLSRRLSPHQQRAAPRQMP